MNWLSHFDENDLQIINELNLPYPSREVNIFTDTLRRDQAFQSRLQMFNEAFPRLYTIKRLSRMAAIYQMVHYDHVGGPDHDHQPKGLRRQWYAWYKVDFAMPFSKLLGQDYQETSWTVRWAGNLSTTFADLVDVDLVTYRDLWVIDTSRMQKRFWEELFEGANIIFCVEKDSLFGDFEKAAANLGAKVLYSGKGKSSKAAIEKVLRDAFYWSEYDNPFTAENPLRVIHISDFDYHGRAVIGPTFGQQCRRYTPYVEEARIGIEPVQIQDAGYEITEKWYQIKKGNAREKQWAREIAMKLFHCRDCGTYQISNREHFDQCPHCGVPGEIDILEDGYGFEVEAMRTSEYMPYIVAALLQLIPYDELLEYLRDECVADLEAAADRVTRRILENNERYARYQRAIDQLRARMQNFENEVRSEVYDVGDGHERDWREEEEDPEEDDFVRHVSNGYGSPWRPFSTDVRTDKLVDYILEDTELIDRLTNMTM